MNAFIPLFLLLPIFVKSNLDLKINEKILVKYWPFKFYSKTSNLKIIVWGRSLEGLNKKNKKKKLLLSLSFPNPFNNEVLRYQFQCAVFQFKHFISHNVSINFIAKIVQNHCWPINEFEWLLYQFKHLSRLNCSVGLLCGGRAWISCSIFWLAFQNVHS